MSGTKKMRPSFSINNQGSFTGSGKPADLADASRLEELNKIRPYDKYQHLHQGIV